ncbi:LuxR family transcriptional regulator [Epibacterium ulvae]|uniref:LuxR family transcriptional regulator n=1 Tax=Epibacterium ulvae TaxID=1156985 RepID=A0A1G5Q7Q6_9RHOB|nr:autoinducer binding domain-containing protein [Epibacterium ulvae]SCZ57915.1 LuxR family transcriptional regulator [Epibacterium ulvae]
MAILDYLHEITETRSLEQLWKSHQDKMAEYGFTRIIYGYTRHKTARSLGDPEDFLVLSNHSTDYLDGFIRSGLYFHAPMVQWAIDNDGACSWDWVQEQVNLGLLAPAAERVLEFNQKMDLTAGYTVSFPSASGRFRGAISLAAAAGVSQTQVNAIWETHGADIQLMNNIAHLKIITLPYVSPHRSLTERQKETLQWVGDGKTTRDIAMIMGLTPATIEKHLRLARESLAVDTTAQAVLKAAMLNQIFQMEN